MDQNESKDFFKKWNKQEDKSNYLVHMWYTAAIMFVQHLRYKEELRQSSVGGPGHRRVQLWTFSRLAGSSQRSGSTLPLGKKIIFMQPCLVHYQSWWAYVFNLAFMDLFGTTTTSPPLNAWPFYSSTTAALTLVALPYDGLHLPAALPREGDSQNHDCLFLGLNLGRRAHCVGLVTTLSFCWSVEIHSYFCDHGPGLQWPIPQLSRQLPAPYIYVLTAALVHLKLFVHQLHSGQSSHCSEGTQSL